jgi:hypothetical protein
MSEANVKEILRRARKAATMLQAISGLTQSDEYAAAAFVVNGLAETGYEELLSLIEAASAVSGE